MNQNNLIKIGVTGKSFGLFGEIAFVLDNKNSDVLRDDVEIFIKQNGLLHKTKIKNSNKNNKIKIKEIKNATEAKKLKNLNILIKRRRFVVAKNNELYLVDILNFKVINRLKINLGEIIAFSINSRQPSAEVKTPSGRIVNVPIIKPILNKIKKKSKEVILDPPDGIFE